jgi:single-strand DNA-binding protein
MLAVEVMTMSDDVETTSGVNEVTLRGRVSSVPVARDLPSGTSIMTFRVSVPRGKTAMTSGSRQTSDWVDCVAWAARPKKSVRSWVVGDTVEVEGALRRRFFRVGGTAANTRVEVEVLRGRIVARAAS